MKNKNTWRGFTHIQPNDGTMLKRPFLKNKGFTLIELLVVVLIIGILAAVAVPQYRKAVYKSHATEAMMMLKAIEQAQEVYYLAHGEYTNDINVLDVGVPAELIGTGGENTSSDRYVYSCQDKRYCSAHIANASMPFFEIHHRNSPGNELAGIFFCHLGSKKNRNNTAKSICQSLGKQDTSVTASWFVGNYFRLN